MKRPGFDIALSLLAEIENPVVIDVGAYIGKIVRLCKEANPKVVVHTLEPDPANYKILFDSYGADTSVHCYKAAVAGEDGMKSFYTTNRAVKGSSRSNTLFKKVLKDKKKQGKKMGDIKKITVVTYSMNTLLKDIKKVDLLKLNCEGGEYEIFDGNLDFLEKTQMIYVSFHSQNKPFSRPEYEEKRQKAYKSLKSAGFVLKTEESKKKKHIWQLWVK